MTLVKKRENEWNISVEVPRLWQWSQKNSKDRDDLEMIWYFRIEESQLNWVIGKYVDDFID